VYQLAKGFAASGRFHPLTAALLRGVIALCTALCNKRLERTRLKCAVEAVYFFPWNVKSCVWLPVTALNVDVTVTEPPEAMVVSWLTDSVTMWLCAESVDDVYEVMAGCI